MAIYDFGRLISETRRLAAEYRKATGKPLPVTGEIARHDACRLLQLEPVEPGQQGGYDAIGKPEKWQGLRFQIKGRAILDESKSGQRLGQLKMDKDWDAILLVLLNDEFEPQEIYMASREQIEEEMSEVSSKRQNRGAMSVARFKHTGLLVWNDVEGLVDNEIWSNRP